MQNNIVCIIPARGGSKGISRKNLIDFAGKPLIAWSIIQARQSRLIREVYVSSDDEEILETAQNYYAKIIKRPNELATDTATSESCLVHAINEIETNSGKIDYVVFLQATSPLRTPEDIDNSIQKMIDSSGDSLFSMCLLDDYCIWSSKDDELYSFTYDYKNRGRRQDRKPMFLENGSIYIFKPRIIRENNNRLGGKIIMYEMESWKSFEIDSQENLRMCETIMKEYLIGGRHE
jgi:N-acylneuraminate cytidylyltransferase